MEPPRQKSTSRRDIDLGICSPNIDFLPSSRRFRENGQILLPLLPYYQYFATFYLPLMGTSAITPSSFTHVKLTILTSPSLKRLSESNRTQEGVPLTHKTSPIPEVCKQKNDHLEVIFEKKCTRHTARRHKIQVRPTTTDPKVHYVNVATAPLIDPVSKSVLQRKSEQTEDKSEEIRGKNSKSMTGFSFLQHENEKLPLLWRKFGSARKSCLKRVDTHYKLIIPRHTLQSTPPEQLPNAPDGRKRHFSQEFFPTQTVKDGDTTGSETPELRRRTTPRFTRNTI